MVDVGGTQDFQNILTLDVSSRYDILEKQNLESSLGRSGTVITTASSALLITEKRAIFFYCTNTG